MNPPQPAVLDEYTWFCRRFAELTGLDLSQYKRSQMERRIRQIMARHGASQLAEYLRLLAGNPARLEEFKAFLTINVTEFFRDPGLFAALEELLPGLMAGRRGLAVWSAGCANGAEAYSLAILLHELLPGGRHRVVGSDLDQEALAAAEAAVYGAEFLRQVRPEWLRRYFVPEGDRWRVRRELLPPVTFQQHDLLKPPWETGWDLIACRNVVIYLHEQAKAAVFRRLAGALRPGGLLFVGGTETIMAPLQLGLAPVRPFLYRRVETRAAEALARAEGAR